MKKSAIILLGMAFIMTACCPNYDGYGRYTLKVDCQTVTINGNTYQLTQNTTTNDFIINGETLHRGIMRKVKPWLYIHRIYANQVDVTFDNGSKEIYPLYVGSSGSIFSVFEHPWDIKQSTCLSFANDHWLVAHLWADNGIYFDLQKNLGDVKDWTLLQEVFVPNDGAEHTIPVINVNIQITSYSPGAKTATIDVSQGN